MPNWTESMQQTFEYYVVDPGTWKDTKKLDNMKTSTVNRDSSVETLGSATFDATETVGECYVRVYLITIQKGVTERHALGTFLIQTPSSSFDGKVRNITMDAYTPLLELKEKQPPIGYSILKDENVMDNAYRLTQENSRAPVVKTVSTKTLHNDFVADPNDTWVTYLSALIANDKKVFDLDELGRILFSPKQDTASLQPVWEFNDDNSSILHPDFDMTHDIYGIPNVVEVIYSGPNDSYYAKVVNDDPNSPISTVSRGREIPYRVTDPNLNGEPTQDQINEYAEQLLRDMSTLEYTVTFTHGYCPVRLHDCVRLNYSGAGIENVKAKVISQTIKCEPGCPVTTKAVFTKKLWG